MPTPEAIRAALEKFVAAGASKAERRLIGDALRAGRLVLAEGERSVALGGSADGATIVTGSGNVILRLDAAAAHELRVLLGPPVPLQLPSDLIDFTGREREIAALEQALGDDRERCPITSIHGMGGVGKTTLAVYVAHRLKERYPDGQIVVRLEGTSAEPLSPTEAMVQVIFALDPAQELPNNVRALPGLYRSLLAGKRLLILFDDAADMAQVRELLPSPPSAAIVTSRRAVVLPGLQQLPLNMLAPEEADALLLQIIGGGRASAEERATLTERCGYLPLALRVGGTFLVKYPDWGVGEYLTALADERKRLKRLRIEGDALLDVAAVLGLSLQQLGLDRPELVERWRMLAVFRGGFDREAAATVWTVARAEARDGLSPLLERSMLLFDAANQRYRLHDLMRDLALGATEPLTEEEERCLEKARDRHSAHYQRLLAQANTTFKQGGEAAGDALARFDQERVNIEAGWRWLSGQAAHDKIMSRRCSDFVGAGYPVLALRQPPRLQIEWLETARAAARRVDDCVAEGWHLGSLGVAYKNLGEYRRAIRYHKQALAISRKNGDHEGEGSALGNLGLVYFRVGEYRRAIEYHEQHLAIARKNGDRRGEANARSNLEIAYASLGEYNRAIVFFEQQLARARKNGDRLGEGRALGNLGTIYLRVGEHGRAIDLYEQVLPIAREIDDHQGEGITLFNVALALDAVGERAQAITRMREAAEVFAATESPAVEQARAKLREWSAVGLL